MTKVVMKNCHVDACIFGTVMPSDGDIEYVEENSRYGRVHTHLLIQEPESKSFLARIGLPPDTPTSEVLAVIDAIRNLADPKQVDVSRVVQDSALWQRIANAANVSQIISALALAAGMTFG